MKQKQGKCQLLQKSVFLTQVAFGCLSDKISYVEIIFWLLNTAKTAHTLGDSSRSDINIHHSALPAHVVTSNTIF